MVVVVLEGGRLLGKEMVDYSRAEGVLRQVRDGLKKNTKAPIKSNPSQFLV
jgi:predicted DNA-binding protein